MTTFARPDNRLEISAEQLSDAASLRAWLADRWAILFSHPADFSQEEMEMDRWVNVLSRSFGGHDIAPVTLARAGGRPLADLATGALRALIARCGPRFALIIDSDLRCRRALTYRVPAELPSPLELIGWAVALRKRDCAGALQLAPVCHRIATDFSTFPPAAWSPSHRSGGV
jgi:hypothetical protein